MKTAMLVVLLMSFTGCASTFKKVVDPQNRGEREAFLDGDACYEYAKTGYNSAFIQKYESCMEGKGYTFEYIEEEEYRKIPKQTR